MARLRVFAIDKPILIPGFPRVHAVNEKWNGDRKTRMKFASFLSEVVLGWLSISTVNN